MPQSTFQPNQPQHQQPQQQQGLQQTYPNQSHSHQHPREKIDPNQIPHPATGETDQVIVFHTTQGNLSQQQNQQNDLQQQHFHQQGNPPPMGSLAETQSIGLRLPFATQRFRVIDGGSCSPRFMRSTMQKIPQNASELKNTGLPFGICISPLTEVDPRDQPNFVPQVDFGEHGPVRCTRCQSYVNPFVTFVDNGKNFSCNMCGLLNAVPSWYTCSLDGFGRRRDIQQRPELTLGSVDFVANKSFHIREPKPISFVFVIDTSNSATSQGVISSIVHGLKQRVATLAKSFPHTQVTFITFARSVQFYNLQGGNPKVMFMGDVDKVSIPCPTSQLSITLEQLAENMDILDAMVSIAEYAPHNENACGAALDAAKLILGGAGGRVLLFSAKAPNTGVGEMRVRDDFKLYGNKKEGVLFKSILGYWPKKAQELAKESICVDCFLFPINSFMETGTFGEICAVTNGQMHVYERYDPTRDKERLLCDIERHLTRPTGYDAVLRVRCSPGLSVSSYIGNYFKQNQVDMDLAGVDADSSFVAIITYDDKMKAHEPAYVQSAMVYTDIYGRRLIRVHTLRFEVADQIQAVFKFSDTSAVLGTLCREVTFNFFNSKDEIKSVRDHLIHRSIEILTKYRKHCSPVNSPAQLILPEALKMLPVYLLGLSKSSAFKHGTTTPIDERIWHTHNLMRNTPARIIQYCYPDLYALHDMEPPIQDGDDSEYPVPPKLPASSRVIENTGIFMIDDGINIFFWVGSAVSAEVVQSIFSVESADKITIETRVRPNLGTELGARVASILNVLNTRRAFHGCIRVFKERDAADALFFSRLIEDRYSSQRSYSEHLCFLHEEITQKLS